MTQNSPIQKTLEDILHTQNFERLDSFADSQSWSSLSSEERLLLAKLFVMAAESELAQPKSADPFASAKKSFNMASTLAPQDATIWYRRAIAFSAQDAHNLLEESSLCFEKATSLDENLFTAWYGWGNILMRRGSQQSDANYLMQAEEKFHKAAILLPDPYKFIEFYWHYGLVSFMIGRQSGEACDLHKACQSFRKARELGLNRADFFNDFANALVELSLLINCQDMMFEAIELYLHSIDNEENGQNNPHDLSIRYCNLATCYQYLFEFHHEETFFKQAQDCFLQAHKLQPSFGQPVAFWAELLLYAAKLWQDANLLEGCLDKMSLIDEYAQDKPQLLCRMAEALALFGSHDEDLKVLTEASEIAHSACEIGPELSQAWGALAFVQLELGRYFGDEKHFYNAVESAEKGLSLNQKSGVCWHVIAVSKFSLGEILSDLQLLDESIVAFMRASKLDVGRFGYLWNDWGIAYLNLADITQERKFVQEAIEKFEQAILLHENVNPSWLVNYGSALDFWGDLTDDETLYQKAIEVLNHAINMDPSNLQARYHLGLAYCHQGELSNDLEALQKAIFYMQSVINEDIEDDAAWNDLGMAFLHVAELTQDPMEEEVKFSLYELAEQHFLQSLSLGNQTVYYNLACLEALRENVVDAMHYLEKAQEATCLPPAQDMLEDRWLEGIRHTGQFQQFIQRISQIDP